MLPPPSVSGTLGTTSNTLARLAALIPEPGSLFAPHPPLPYYWKCCRIEFWDVRTGAWCSPFPCWGNASAETGCAGPLPPFPSAHGGVASPTEGRTSQSQSRLARWQLVIGKPHSAPSGAIEVGHLDAQFILAPWVLGLHKQQTQNGELVLITLIQHYCERLFCTTLSLFCMSPLPFN